MPSWTEVLGLPWRFEPWHPSFPLSGRITLQLIGDDHPWNVLASLEQLAEEPFGLSLIATGLDQDIANMAIRIDRPLQIVPLLINREKDLVEVIVTTQKTLALVFHT
jgi:hypothetical protein